MQTTSYLLFNLNPRRHSGTMRKPLIPLCFPKIGGEPMGAPAIFEQQIEIRLLHPASTLKSRIQI
ncbi:MAG: hypothetical protein P8X74_19085 [Reinekea sp.]